ncbi:hypothetical protein STAFG_6388 [Streptomyces afghaniensis 772]|uniref:Uncharacterized protein n=1 Tax=Streptomyces afghaniensis 772 TaxID=1283301 RepID=S4MSH6_9ACTN|nr:hypothetical protein [Streptomyces afghaniensis]EPJ36572.1 hypothetical protein STAFG_6388 [Streptomyces afghaniensis 772]
MVSDHGPGPSPVARLTAALSAAGASPTPRELAELLWMAALLDPDRQEEPLPEPGDDNAPSSATPAPEANTPQTAETQEKADTPAPAPPQPEPEPVRPPPTASR